MLALTTDKLQMFPPLSLGDLLIDEILKFLYGFRFPVDVTRQYLATLVHSYDSVCRVHQETAETQQAIGL